MQGNVYKEIVIVMVSVFLSLFICAFIFMGIEKANYDATLFVFLFVFGTCHRFTKFIFPKD